MAAIAFDSEHIVEYRDSQDAVLAALRNNDLLFVGGRCLESGATCGNNLTLEEAEHFFRRGLELCELAKKAGWK